MIDYIKGEITALSPTLLIMECNGIGYEIHISLTAYGAFREQKAGIVYICEVIREDAHLLFGFATREERELFLLLISVSGVGPNTARMILSSLPPEELTRMIAAGDEKGLVTVKGVGLKTAQRILIDLKNKVKPMEGKPDTLPAAEPVAEEAVSALVMLGFQPAASRKAVQAVLKRSPESTVEQLIKTALKML